MVSPVESAATGRGLVSPAPRSPPAVTSLSGTATRAGVITRRGMPSQTQTAGRFSSQIVVGGDGRPDRGVTEAFSYDSWGRLLTAADGTGNTAATSYDAAGRTRTFNDGKGSYTYSYDGTDQLGRAERRGLTTSIDLGYASGDADVVSGAYDVRGHRTSRADGDTDSIELALSMVR